MATVSEVATLPAEINDILKVDKNGEKSATDDEKGIERDGSVAEGSTQYAGRCRLQFQKGTYMLA